MTEMRLWCVICHSLPIRDVSKILSVMENAADVLDQSPTIAGGVPPAFRSRFHESSLRDAEWIRPPLPGSRCPLTQLSRTTLIELGDSGKIVMKRIRKRNATRGLIIINKKSLLDFLDGLAPVCRVTPNELADEQEGKLFNKHNK